MSVIGLLLSVVVLQREQETTDLKRNIDRLYDQNRDLKNRVKHPRGRRAPLCPAENRFYKKICSPGHDFIVVGSAGSVNVPVSE